MIRTLGYSNFMIRGLSASGAGLKPLKIKFSDNPGQGKVCPLRFSFTKADRILKRHEFIALSNTGRRIQNEHFIAVFAPNELGRSRIGITVTKKVGPAVKRNRIKRMVREHFRLNRHKLAGNWDINLIAKKQKAELSAELAYRSLDNIFERISSDDDY